MNFTELYSIKCLIGHTLFPGCHDWEQRIEMSIDCYDNKTYVRFKSGHICINICEDGQVSVIGLIRKPLKFAHKDLATTSFAIQGELVAYLAQEI